MNCLEFSRVEETKRILEFSRVEGGDEEDSRVLQSPGDECSNSAWTLLQCQLRKRSNCVALQRP